MDNKNVSELGILEGIDYLEKEFIGTMDEEVNEIIDTYVNIQNQGTLSSADIDSVTAGIRSKVTTLQNDFTTLAMELKNSMAQSSENVKRQQTAATDTMSGGM